jgi:uncharacterized protein YndB with AHSA1/START domain
MEGQSVTHSTFVIKRSYPTPPERVFSAFADPAKKRRWYCDDRNMTVEVFEMDFRVGGSDHTRYLTPVDSPLKGAPLTNRTYYQDIVPNRRIVIAYTMAAGDQRFSASLATFELSPSATGTDLVFTEQAAFFENADGPEIREHGWRQLLLRLGNSLES